MAIQKKLIHFKKLESFEEQLNSSNILDTSIVFIKDAKLIWTHGQYYGSTEELQIQISKIITKIEDNDLVIAAALTDLEDRKANISDLEELTGLDIQVSDTYTEISYPEFNDLVFSPVSTDDSLESALGKIENTISNLISAAIDLEERKLDKEGITADIIGLSSDFEIKTYPETGNENVVFDPIAKTDTIETATSKLESNLITLVNETINNELTISAALTDLEDRKVDKTAITGDLVTLSEKFVISEYPEDTGGIEFNPVEASETLDSAINKLESNLVTLLNETLENEEVIASAYTELNDKKLELADLVYEYSESPTETLETLGGNKVYKKFFTLEYTTPGTETTWELSCTTDISTVIVLGLECILKQTLGEEGTVSFDYRDQYLFGDNENILKYYYKHNTGSLIIKFTSNTTTILYGSIKFSCSGEVVAGDSSNTTQTEVVDGGYSA